MSAIDVYRDEQITVAQQTIYQVSDTFMLPVEERWTSRTGNIRSEIHFVHRWTGVFRLECTRPLAMSLTSLMLSLDAGELSDEDIADVMGEILNTIAGNLKDMYKNIVAIGSDLVFRGASAAPTIRVEGMMVAGGTSSGI